MWKLPLKRKVLGNFCPSLLCVWKLKKIKVLIRLQLINKIFFLLQAKKQKSTAGESTPSAVAHVEDAITLATEILQRHERQRIDPPESGKEELFCSYLCSLLKNLKLESSYEEATLQILNIVTKISIDERRLLGTQGALRNSTSSLESAASVLELGESPESFSASFDRLKASTSTSTPIPFRKNAGIEILDVKRIKPGTKKEDILQVASQHIFENSSDGGLILR